MDNINHLLLPESPIHRAQLCQSKITARGGLRSLRLCCHFFPQISSWAQFYWAGVGICKAIVPNDTTVEQRWGFGEEHDRVSWCRAFGKHAPVSSLLSLFFWCCNSWSTRFATRSLHFTDCYSQGLNGFDATWAGHKYSGHQTLPPGWHTDIKAERKWREEEKSQNNQI